MLYRAEIENFFSIAEPQVIDLRARKSVEDILGRLSPIYDGADWRCPNVVALYGPNAAGKSNVLRAIAFGSWFLSSSFSHPINQQLPYLKFATNEEIDKPTRLCFVFSGPADFHDTPGNGSQCSYTYELVLSPRNSQTAILESSTDFVTLERLSYQPRGYGKPTTIIERRSGGMLRYVKGFMDASHEKALKAILRRDSSIISTLAQMNHDVAATFASWILNITSNIFDVRVQGDDVDATRWYASNPKAFNELQEIGKRIDLGIEQIVFDLSAIEPQLKFRHSGLDHEIKLQMESHGTREFIRLFPWIQLALDQGSIAIIDDIDTGLHPVILAEVLRWFSDRNRNPHGAQLWMTCHSTSLMNELVKEGIVFCDKDSKGRTAVYRLSDIEGVRRSENFFGKYMGGEYGAVPNLG